MRAKEEEGRRGARLFDSSASSVCTASRLATAAAGRNREASNPIQMTNYTRRVLSFFFFLFSPTAAATRPFTQELTDLFCRPIGETASF